MSRWCSVPLSWAPRARAALSVATGSGSSALSSRLRRGALKRAWAGLIAELREALALGLALGLALSLLALLALAALGLVGLGDDADRRLEGLVGGVLLDVLAARAVAARAAVVTVVAAATAAPSTAAAG